MQQVLISSLPFPSHYPIPDHVCTTGDETPVTTSKEWQEATNEYARINKINPISGVASEGYKGSGFVHIPKN
jgi:hypothetical protein